MKERKTLLALVALLEVMTLGCASENSPKAATSGGATGQGGATAAAGTKAMGGSSFNGGMSPTGGANSTGGSSATGGASANSGSNSTGGHGLTGGVAAVGGMNSTGGSQATGGIESTGGAIATGGFAATGGASTPGGTQSAGGSLATGGTATTGGALATGGLSAAGGSSANSIILDTVQADDRANWTQSINSYNPVVTFEEIVSPYDGGVALRTVATGNTTAMCEMQRAWRDFQLATKVRTDTVALQLYLALDSDMTEYNWPGLEVVLYNDGNLVGYIMYYRADATGAFIMQRTADWHAVPDNGFQILPLGPLFDANNNPNSADMEFDKISVQMFNYTCVGNNSIVIDNLSLVPLDQ